MNVRTVLRSGGGIALGILMGIVLMNHNASPLFENVSIVSPAASAVSTNVAATADTYAVLKVIDGDTITIAMDGKSVTLRLIGLDTPETVGPRKPLQCFGKEASDKAKEMLAGKRVRLEMDPSQGTFDKYGRTLAYVFLSDPSTPFGAGRTNFNKYMIAEGYGHEYTYNLPYKYQSEFKAAEKQAREKKKGLWADGVCGSLTSTRPNNTPASAEATTGTYNCTKNTYNCSSFKTQLEAQHVFTLCGGDANDIHKLDSDKDGTVCESLP